MVGASISGLYLGYLLAREGLEVEVYEKEKEGKVPKRTLIVTSKMNDFLDFDTSEVVINKVTQYEFLTDGQRAKLELEKPDLVVERKALLQILAQQALAAGARIFWGHEVVEINREKGLKKNSGCGGESFFLKIVDLNSGQQKLVRQDVVVLANGFNSSISTRGEKRLAIVQARVVFPEKGAGGLEKNKDRDVDKEIRARTCQVWFDVRRTSYFFWLIPESSEEAACGLIDEDMGKAEVLLRLFLEEKRLRPIEFQAAFVPEYKGDGFINSFKSDRLNLNGFSGGRRLYAVGDAAAQVKMTTVGGVVAGLRGARAVAEDILNKRNSDNYRRVVRELYFELNLHYLLRKILNRFRNEDYARLLAKIERDAELKRMLGCFTRDELSSLLFKLSMKRPWLLFFVLRRLL